MRNLKLIRLSFVFALTAVLAGGLEAQNVNTPPAVQTLNLERVLDTKSVLTTLTPNVPPVILAGVLTGALELRESVNFNPTSQLLTLNAFSVQTGSPFPTPAGTNIFSSAVMNVDKVYSSL